MCNALEIFSSAVCTSIVFYTNCRTLIFFLIFFSLHFLSVCIGIVLVVYYAVSEHVQDIVSLGGFVYDAGII